MSDFKFSYIGYIYSYTNIINGKVYIGKTFDKERRHREHISDSKKEDTKFYRAVRKYGWDNFNYRILVAQYFECDIKEANSILNQYEMDYISKYDSFKNGYNSTLGGDGTLKYSKAELKKIRADIWKAYYEKNKETLAEKDKAYREANKEAIAEKQKAYKKAYIEANRNIINEKKKSYREANREVLAEKQRNYVKENKEKIKAYREANKETIAEKQKAYSEANKEAIAKQKKAYYEANKEKIKAKKEAKKLLLESENNT